MSQSVGQNFKSRIPTLGDDASIEEALRVYHYGIDNYSVGAIPNDSIEGNFRTLDTKINSLESSLNVGFTQFIRRESQVSAPNIITGQVVGGTTTVVPLVIRAVASQSVPLQNWQNSSANNVATISTAGSFSLAGYISTGTTTISSSISASINILNSSHKGIVIRSAPSQTANIQEWQDSSGAVIASINKDGDLQARRIDCGSP